ncbi:hypothetical protein Tco_0527279 [Tanacetum coccineum]
MGIFCPFALPDVTSKEKLIIRSYEVQLNYAFLNLLSYKVVSYVNVLGSGVLDIIAAESNGTASVTIQGNLIEDKAVVCMDKTKITRKQSKASKHGHENQKSTKPKPQKPKTFANFLLRSMGAKQGAGWFWYWREDWERVYTRWVVTEGELHQLDTFYNSLNTNDQDALDSAAGGNFLDKMPREGLAIIESKSKVRYSRSRPNDSRAITNAPSSTSSPSNNSFEIQQMAPY